MEENFKTHKSTIIKIVVFGPECSGKTTLATQLAHYFQTPLVVTDDFAQKQQSLLNVSEEQLLNNVQKQSLLETEMLAQAEQLLLYDSHILSLKIILDKEFEMSSSSLNDMMRSQHYDLFLLTDIDVPFSADPVFFKNINRESVHNFYEQELLNLKKPYLKVSGNKEKRFQKAITIIESLQQALNAGFNAHDFAQLYQRGISIDKAIHQWEILKKGITKAVLDRPAKLNDGIRAISESESIYYANFFDEKAKNIKLKKFVPASGAATRMFKFLNEFLNEFKLGEESINAYINRKKDKNLPVFLVGKEKFPFYPAVLQKTRDIYPDYDFWSRDLKDFSFIKTMLSSEGFHFAHQPKGVIPFHQYSTHIATPIEEHLNECSFYTTSKGKSYLHFTVSKEHLEAFEDIVSLIKPKIELQHSTEISVSYSFQDSATDTISIDSNGELFRNSDGSLLFRPGGHGALIKNLNSLDADVVFVKNIDNVIQNHIEEISLYKKALGGILIEIQDVVFRFLKDLDALTVDKNTIEDIVNFVQKRLQINIFEDFYKYTKENKIEFLRTILNRPIRVCGMVKNEGEPGGGPFWVKDAKGNVFLQIVESSQVDHKEPSQLAILNAATHFNPVDLVCGLKNYRGFKFDVTEFVDHNSGFIVEKNKEGRSLKSYELPGLWNGAMAKWLTVFIEVPLVTFNPVKTVNDLLKSAHQPL